MLLRIPFRLPGLDECNPLEIPMANLTLLFGRETPQRWNRIVERSPEDVNKRIILAHLLHVEKCHEEALAQYRIGLELLAAPGIAKKYSHADSLKAQIHYNLGRVFLAMERRQEARTEWERVLTLDSKFGELARRLLITYPADGTVPGTRYIFIVFRTPENVSTEEFDNAKAVWPLYRNLKKAVRRRQIAGVALIGFHPDPHIGIGICKEITKHPEERAVIQERLDGFYEEMRL